MPFWHKVHASHCLPALAPYIDAAGATDASPGQARAASTFKIASMWRDQRGSGQRALLSCRGAKSFLLLLVSVRFDVRETKRDRCQIRRWEIERRRSLLEFVECATTDMTQSSHMSHVRTCELLI